MQPLTWQEKPGGVEVRVRVTPRGGRDAVDGVDVLGDGKAVLKVRVRAVPEGGAANEAVRRLIATMLGRPASAVRLAAGATSRVKTLSIAGDPAEIARGLDDACRPEKTA
jgi:uncharacterized protein YggU (UPF0235/DUF167 family)